jgi:hypothetical protein
MRVQHHRERVASGEGASFVDVDKAHRAKGILRPLLSWSNLPGLAMARG